MNREDLLVQIRQIASALHDSRPSSGRATIGRAALMIGAGFSRNAQKTSPDSPEFPKWVDLAASMHRELYPNRKSIEKDPLRIASEYEATFGTSRLFELLEQVIPNSSYVPNSLYTELLSLRWTDIFTTNYDTLLERTNEIGPILRKYDIVYDYTALPVTTQPRIIKLHGTFPTHKPYIITEEHFRTYPVNYAPFVNLVQQSLMENCFCLIGFSADDPNFLRWIGWVRDNLNQYAPRMFLVTRNELSFAETTLLHSRNITVLNIGLLQEPGEELNYAQLYLRFIRQLRLSQPPDPKDWPYE